ncbi:lysoplasmalogenase [Aurantibacter crassamenti]|uniref:lysoplasmalogenase n=1 Tax=Aurantibacter crassamenti TaxID=1837375 RepID=UPI00193A4154|nr:lysoplasmalogenase [Aurantibacter crassamenti]MBM1107882.1 lysoplasmalogenase [Aurantibacter crassamenti]
MKHLKPFLWCYAFIVLLELIVVGNPDFWPFRIISKPLIVLSIIVFFLFQEVDKKTRIIVFGALLFSLIGDLLLIYDEIYENLFYGGLFAFFMAHILHTLQFSRNRNKELGILAPLFVLSGYAIAIYLYLYDSLGDFVIPVGIYITVHLVMILFAYLRDDSMINNSYIYVLAGSFIFMFADSILAITRFKSDIQYSRIMVMGFYSIAQLLVIIGIIKGSKVHLKKGIKAY